jgi:putative ABC transport system ATP-binding protein
MADANGTLIKMEGVKKVFFTDEVETHALEEIHLEIKKGTYISIAGPSGCGKSTLLSILGLLDSPTDGNYWLNGQPVANLTISERTRIRNREIGFIFQAFNLIGDLTVYENVELPLTYRGTSSSERKQKVQNALERVGMAHRLRHYPSQLSGGQQQRVAVARALVGDPLILMADEPTGNLDSKNGEAVMEPPSAWSRTTSATPISPSAPSTSSTAASWKKPRKPASEPTNRRGAARCAPAQQGVQIVAALPCRGQHAAPQLGKAYKILKKHDYVLKTVRWNIHARGVFTAREELYANNSARFALRDARTCEEQQVFLTPAPLSGDSSARTLAPVLSEAEGPSGE